MTRVSSHRSMQTLPANLSPALEVLDDHGALQILKSNAEDHFDRDSYNMAQDISAMATIIGIAGAGFRLSLTLNAVSCEVANTGLEVHSIAKAVTLFSSTLKQTGSILQSADSVHSEEALAAAKQIADDSRKVFEDVQDMLDRVRIKRPDGTYTPTIQQRFRWCFKRARVQYLLGQLESLKLSLSLLLQIQSLGRSMASTSKNDSPEEVAIKKNEIQQERLEAQNAVIVRYWQTSKIDRLYDAAQIEDEDDQEAREDGQQKLLTDGSSQLTVSPPVEYAPTAALTKLPIPSLGDLDNNLHLIKQSPKDMLRISNEAIDPLLDRWTNWHDIRERRHTRNPNSRFVPSVDNLYEDDEDRPYHQRYMERDDSPRGFYLEGATTDWRQPHSMAARQDAAKRRKQFTGYQPSVSAASSDVEDSPSSKGSKKKSSRHHVINSDSETSDSEPERPQPQRRRRSSGSPAIDKKMLFPDGTPVAHTQGSGQPTSTRQTQSGGSTTPGGGSQRSSWSSQYNMPPAQRPLATPDQNGVTHSMTAPLSPISTGTAPGLYPPPGHWSPNTQQRAPPPYSPYYPPAAPPPSGYNHQPMSRMSAPIPQQRPISQDGRPPRSPSRLSQHTSSTRHGKTEGEERKATKDKSKNKLREGATKGLLGAGAIAAFMEALGELDI